MIARGALAGGVTIVVFAAVHHLLISAIWSMLPVMVLAGAATGASLSWCHGRLDPDRSPAAWFALCGSYLVLLGLLGASSLVLFDPETTFAAVSEASGPVDDLILRALPLCAAWAVTVTVLGATTHHLRTRQGLRVLPALFVTTLLVLLTLGLNMSVLGLVELEARGWGAVARFCGLVVVVVATHAGVFALLAARSEEEPLVTSR